MWQTILNKNTVQMAVKKFLHILTIIVIIVTIFLAIINMFIILK